MGVSSALLQNHRGIKRDLKTTFFYTKNNGDLAIKEEIKAFNFYTSSYGKHKERKKKN